jgi:hypothetical protein
MNTPGESRLPRGEHTSESRLLCDEYTGSLDFLVYLASEMASRKNYWSLVSQDFLVYSSQAS